MRTSNATLSQPAVLLVVALIPALLLFSRLLADITLVLIAIAFLYYSYQSKQWQWLKMPWLRAIALFVFYLAMINTPFSVEPSQSFLKALAFLRWPIFACAMAFWVLNDFTRLRAFLIGLAITIVFIITDTTWQYIYGVDFFGFPPHSAERLTGPFRAPIPGTMLLRVLFLLLCLSWLYPWLKRETPQLVFIMSILLLGLLTIFISGERMAFLLMLLGSGLIFIGLIKASHAIRFQLLAMMAILSLSLVSMIGLLPDMATRTIYSTFDKLAHFAESDYGHVFYAAYQVWLTAPWLGVGFDAYQFACDKQQLLTTCSHPHNLYLLILSETGVIGLLLFILFVIHLFKTCLTKLWQQQQWLLVSITAAILTISFWPLYGGVNILSNWFAAIVWLSIGFSLTIGVTASHLLTSPHVNAANTEANTSSQLS